MTLAPIYCGKCGALIPVHEDVLADLRSWPPEQLREDEIGCDDCPDAVLFPGAITAALIRWVEGAPARRADSVVARLRRDLDAWGTS